MIILIHENKQTRTLELKALNQFQLQWFLRGDGTKHDVYGAEDMRVLEYYAIDLRDYSRHVRRD